MSSFVERDVQILRRHFSVRTLRWRHTTGLVALLKAAKRSDVLYSWFAGPYAALAAYCHYLNGARSVVMLGGYDCARIDEIGFGAFLNPVLAGFVRMAVDSSDIVAAVDPSLIRDLRLAHPTDREIRVVPTGYDGNWFVPAGPKQPLVLSVAELDESSAVRKGLFTFAQTAKATEGFSFVLAGPIRSSGIARKLRELSAGKLRLVGRVSDDDLLRLYQAAKVYCQLSRHEGLPNALCEAMLCGCVPVGTKFGGIPTAMGDTGEYCEWNDVESTRAAIIQAAKADGDLARARILDIFPLGRRDRELVRLIRDAVPSGA